MEEILMTNGNTQAYDFVLRLLVEQHVKSISGGAGGPERQCAYVAMDDPTYFLAGSIAKRYCNMLNFAGTPGLEAGVQPLLTLRMCVWTHRGVGVSRIARNGCGAVSAGAWRYFFFVVRYANAG